MRHVGRVLVYSPGLGLLREPLGGVDAEQYAEKRAEGSEACGCDADSDLDGAPGYHVGCGVEPVVCVVEVFDVRHANDGGDTCDVREGENSRNLD